METKVFERKKIDGKIVNSSLYNFTIGIVLCWGFLVNWLMVKYIPVDMVKSIDPRLFLLGYFLLCFLGVHLFNKYTNPLISFLGYNLVVIPFGFVINIIVSRYDSNLVLEAMRITGIVTMIMMALGSIYPKVFKKIVGILTFSLLIVIIVELVEIFIFHIHHGIIDWIVVLIFCGYIGYDWARANEIPKTIDNAVDSAAALYMDIINLFVRILSILGRKK